MTSRQCVSLKFINFDHAFRVFCFALVQMYTSHFGDAVDVRHTELRHICRDNGIYGYLDDEMYRLGRVSRPAVARRTDGKSRVLEGDCAFARRTRAHVHSHATDGRDGERIKK